MQIDRETPLNPIHQDTKNDVLRYIANIFPHKGYPGNYGSIPQTWEDIYYKTPETGTTGDNDPVDIIEIGQEIGFPGQIKQVKFLGGLLMLDDNQTDWKLIALDINDKWAPHVNGKDKMEKRKEEELFRSRIFKIFPISTRWRQDILKRSGIGTRYTRFRRVVNSTPLDLTESSRIT